MAGSNRDDEARERARQRLEARRIRMQGEEHPSRQRAAQNASAQSGGSRIGETIAGMASQIAGRLGLKGLVIAGVVVLVLVLFVVLLPRCTATPEPEAPALTEPEPAQVQPEVEPEIQSPINEAALVSLLGDDLTASLVQAATTNEDTAWIAAHPDAYAVDGEDVQRKLLKLSAVEPEAVPFVRGFPDAYPAETATPSDTPSAGTVPRLYQWDIRWGYTVYSSTTFALTGCCPTSLSMVYQGLTGNGDLSPFDMGQRAREGGYETEYNGTDAFFLVNEAPSLGLSCEMISVDADALRGALSSGCIVICNVGAGDFTEGGHFFVITGANDDGTITINDPYSAERSNRSWDIDQVLSQTMALYAYSRA